MPVPMPDYGWSAIDVKPELGITSSQSEGGLIITSRRGDPNWTGTLSTGILGSSSPNQHADFLAFLSRCVDLNFRVDFVHPMHRYPDGYDDSNWPLTDDPTLASITDLRNLNLSGLAIGMLLPRGTRLSLVQGSGDSQVISHRWLAADVTVTSSTAQAIEITPRLPIGVFVVGCAVVFKDPVMRLMIVPDSWDAAEAPDPSSITFGVAESLR